MQASSVRKWNVIQPPMLPSKAMPRRVRAALEGLVVEAHVRERGLAVPPGATE